MSDCISRKALHDAIYAQYRTAEQIQGLCVDEHLILLTIENTSSLDAVAVVRCKACKNHKHHEVFGTRICTVTGKMVKELDYCSYGQEGMPDEI